MHKITDFLQERREKEKHYLVDGKRAIASSNLNSLSFISIASLVLVAFDLVCAFLLMGIRPSTPQIVLLGVTAAFAAAANLYRIKAKKPSPKIVLALSLAFELSVLILIIFIDIIYSKEVPALYMPIVITALASGLFFSRKMTNIIQVSYVAIYIFVDLMAKVDYEWVWKYDVCTALIGFAFATVVSIHHRNSLISEYTTKMKYKSLSQRDPLLENIYNKRGYEDAIDNYLTSNNPNCNCAFIVLDLNDFKHINDNYGHDMGDQILRCMSDTLVSLFRDSDIIGRFGGDEFIVLADGLCDEDAVEKKCRYIAELIGRKAQETGAIKVFSSLGAVLCENQSVDFERLFEIADKAMYEAKERGRKADQFILRRYTDEDEEA